MTNSSLTHFDIADLWPDYRPTPLVQLPTLAGLAGIGQVLVKCENERPLGNFKVLGGTAAALRVLAKAANVARFAELTPAHRESLPRLICASDGNHGLAVATAASRAGTNASIYLPAGISRARAARIEACGGETIEVSGTYDDAVHAAAAAAARGDGILIPDTSSDPDDAVVGDVMAGYALLTDELAAQCRDQAIAAPTHLFVQAGVGGLAAAMAEGLRDLMHAPAKIAVVEPETAACVARALQAGHPVRIDGDLRSCAEMLSCGIASAPALRILQRHVVRSVLVGEGILHSAVGTLRDAGGPETTPSGAAGLAGLLHVAAEPGLRDAHRLDRDSRVLLVITEGPVDDR